MIVSRLAIVLPIVALVSVGGCTAKSGGEDTGVSTAGTQTSEESSAGSTSAQSEASGESSSEDTGLEDESSTTGPTACQCAPNGDLVYLASWDGELWSYDPAGGDFEMITTVCPAGERVFSLAVDHQMQGWVQFTNGEMRVVDLNAPQGCEDPSWPGENQGYGLAGMSFVPNAPAPEVCDKLFLHSYSGDGPFVAGPDLGTLGVYDPDSGDITTLSDIDFDGGELAGTGNARLFAVAGPEPATLTEYDKQDGAVLTQSTLTGFSKTRASAFAFHSGDLYLFNEAPPPNCDSCLDGCAPEWAACTADSACSDQFQCVLDTGMITDECGGTLPSSVQDCLGNTCQDECFPPLGDVQSQVWRYDLDSSEGPQPTLTPTILAPIRVVGAATSVCAPFDPL